ncbi:hypothetical protein Bca4012_098621 [Brassica carinata]
MLHEHFSLNKWNLLYILSEAYHGYGDDCFFVKLSSSLLWFQIYGLGAYIVNTSLSHTDFDLRNKFLNPKTPAIGTHHQECKCSSEQGGLFEPFSIKSYWQSLIQHPLGQGNKNRLSRLQVLMATTLLRRTKEKSLIGLPPKNVRYMITWKEKPKLYDDVSLCPPELRSLNTLTSIEDVTDKSELLQKLVAILQDGEDLRF